MMSPTRWVQGAGLLILFGLLQSLGSVAVRECVQNVPHLQILGLQAAGALLWLLPWLAKLRHLGLRSAHPVGMVLRGLVVLAALSCLFFSLSLLGLGDAILLSNLAPLFVPILAWIFLAQPPHTAIWVSGLLGFWGIYLVLNPTDGGWNSGWLIGVLGGFLMGVSYLQIEWLGKTEPPQRVVLYTLGTIAGVLLPYLAFCWTPMSAECWALTGAASLALAGTSITLVQGLMMGPTAELSPFTYFSVVFGYLWGVLFYHQSLCAWQVVGALLVIVAGCIALRWRRQS